MNLAFDSQAVELLTNYEDLLNQTLDQSQLEQICHELIDTFFLYIEEMQNYKSEICLELKSKQTEIDMLHLQNTKQINQLEDQKGDLTRQIEICQQLELQLQCSEKKTQKSEKEILQVEAELRKKLHQQNQQYRDQIQILTSVQEEIDKQILQLSREKGQLQLQFEQLQKKYEEQQFLISNLTEQLANLQTNSSFNTKIQQNNDVVMDSQDDSIEIKPQEKRGLYSNCISHNQINFKWEKIQPSISSIRNSMTVINPTNTGCDLQSRQKIKSLALLYNKPQKQCDPYYEFFKLITQCVKLDLGQAHIFTMNFDYLFEKFKNNCVPFNQWYKKILDEIFT
ncbi:unnamed protein product (macronuclear) [Paramecium tetraurelia]|uniref:Uncharacterized protein n=1 Tax=Paramecium tetraurelia TaxID=5888 RepID=A0E573_PARTE|nr:uncharacterized protein GSPATT00023617001 [Paramecium tetraurelia]CAK90440.1 unnamed protein product [Paramecium tetraurelia]|eukprot:XP_001457837.1 hypothetical protein (macronuclear) [Paramecium tetraurelia strain d4-2]